MNIDNSLALVEQFKGQFLAETIAVLEASVTNTNRLEAVILGERFGVTANLLMAAADIKRASAQIDVVVHAAGILYALPYILEPDEVVESTSLGAGNAGSQFDLVTNQRVAEFKFIRWQGGPEAVRKKTLFEDFYKLARDDSGRAKYLFLLNVTIPRAFLQGSRQIDKVLDRNARLLDDFRIRFGNQFRTVGEFYHMFQNQIELVNLTAIVPGFSVFMERLPE